MKINLNDIHLFQWGILYYEDLDTYIGFDALKEMSKILDKTIRSRSQEFKKLVYEKVKEVDEEYKESYHQHFFMVDELILEQIHIRQQYSSVTSIFSFIEERLKSVCELVENELGFKIKIKDLNSNDMLMRYWNYLIKLFKIVDNPK